MKATTLDVPHEGTFGEISFSFKYIVFDSTLFY